MNSEPGTCRRVSATAITAQNVGWHPGKTGAFLALRRIEDRRARMKCGNYTVAIEGAIPNHGCRLALENGFQPGTQVGEPAIAPSNPAIVTMPTVPRRKLTSPWMISSTTRQASSPQEVSKAEKLPTALSKPAHDDELHDARAAVSSSPVEPCAPVHGLFPSGLNRGSDAAL